jgi:hypothetical protein
VIDDDQAGSMNGKRTEGYFSPSPSMSTFVADPPA